ncbi:MAG TPA: sigma 54-interacting transcriptional regulator [Puia sp.]|nr:sigma 54-interacting transcriptional regulator [Puia sp.]
MESASAPLFHALFHELANHFHFLDWEIYVVDDDRWAVTEITFSGDERDWYYITSCLVNPPELIRIICTYETVQVRSTAYWRDRFPDTGGLKDFGYVEHLYIPLGLSDGRRAVVKFHTDRTGEFDLPVIQDNKVAARLLVPLNTFLENMSLQESLIERDVLLSLNRDIASSRDKMQLTQILLDKLGPLFGSEGVFVYLFDREQETVAPYLIAVNERYNIYSNYTSLINQSMPIDDGMTDRALSQQGALLVNIDQLPAKYQEVGRVKLMRSNGVKQSLNVVLVSGSEIIGLLSLSSTHENTFGKHHLQLVRQVADLVSIALINILSNEEIMVQNKEKEVFLLISREIAQVRKKQDLLQTLRRHLRSIIPYTDAAIGVVDEPTGFQRIFLTDVDEARFSHPDYDDIVTQLYPPNDGIFDVALKSQGPIVWDWDEIIGRQQVPDYVEFGFKTGLIESVGIALRDGNKDFGVLYLASDKKNTFTKHHLTLLEVIASHLSTAVANISSNEEIERKDHEKSILLSLGSDISHVRDKNDLLQVINSRLKKLFSFTHSAIGIIDQGRNTYSSFILDPQSKSKAHPEYDQYRKVDFPVDDGIVDRAISVEEPIVFDLDELSKSAGVPGYVTVNHDMGMKEMVVVALRVKGQPIGFLLLFADGKNGFDSNQLSLLKGIAAQVSTAVSNIIANEGIEKREKEKAVLLSFSNDLATARDAKGLAAIIKLYFRDLLLIREYLITIPNYDDRTFRYFLHELPTEDPTDAGFEILVGSEMPIRGSLTGAVLQSEEPLIFNIAEIVEQGKYSFPSASFWRSAGAENIMGVRLRVAKEDMGILWIQPYQIPDRMLNGISAQLAIALANALANQKIEQQLAEIDRYKQQLEEENLYLQEQIETSHNHGEIIGSGPEMQNVYRMIGQVAFSNSTVLLLGESGTGKELIARAIHDASSRKEKLMVKVNCAALPANLIESELFGHERGSFTGATERRIGKFELANAGTLFLDEIGEMPLDLQVKLLRAIQEREIERVGGKATIKVDVRIIAATNRDLQKEVREGRFRSDLYFRLDVFPIVMPPLRDRKQDIPALVSHFIARYARNAGKQVESISQKAMQELMAYSWPGNVRELEHQIERAILLTNGKVIREMHLPSVGRQEKGIGTEEQYIKTIEENERDHILYVLKKCNGKIFGKGGAAELLGIHVSTLNARIRKLGIKKEQQFAVDDKNIPDRKGSRRKS